MLHIIYAVAVVLWAAEEAALSWPRPALGWLVGPRSRPRQLRLRRALGSSKGEVRWRADDAELPVSVNLSTKTPRVPDLPSWILAGRDKRHLPSSALTVEVTETAAVAFLKPSTFYVRCTTKGSGFPSTTSVPAARRWPRFRTCHLDEIKVDTSLVKASLTSSADEAIVRSVSDLAHRLGLVSVAEGVEDAPIERLMTDIGFDLLQEYHFAKP